MVIQNKNILMVTYTNSLYSLYHIISSIPPRLVSQIVSAQRELFKSSSWASISPPDPIMITARRQDNPEVVVVMNGQSEYPVIPTTYVRTVDITLGEGAVAPPGPIKIWYIIGQVCTYSRFLQ